MSVDGIKQRAAHAWDDPQARSDQYLKKNPPSPLAMSADVYTSSIISLKPVVAEGSVNPMAEPALDIKKDRGLMAWLDSQWKAVQQFFGKKNEPVNKIDIQQDYVKKSKAVTMEPAARSTALKTSLQKQPLQVAQAQESKGFFEKVKDWFEETIEWVKDKWNSFLELIGVRAPVTQTKERDSSRRAKILERHSPLDIEDDFKYLDISQMDPLKAMLAVLVKQGELREEQAFLIQQKILLMQEDLKDLHDQRMQIHAQLEQLGKRSDVLEIIKKVTDVVMVIAGIATAATIAAGAAAIATLGAAAPAVAVLGAITAGINALVYGCRAVNTWLTADTKEKMNKLQGEMLMRNAAREELQFQLKVDVKDMKKIIDSLTGYAEDGSTVLSAQHGK